MSDLDPSNRPRRGIILATAVGALAMVTTGLVLTTTSTTAQASELTRFSSCDEISTWGAGSVRRQATFGGGLRSGGVASAAVDQATSAAAGPAATATSEATGETNVAVSGVDELDLVDRLEGDRVLVAGLGRLSVVDLAAARTLDAIAVAAGAQITYDPDARRAWVVGGPEDRSQPGLTVQRVSVGDDGSLAVDDRWTSSGQLVDARRVGDQLHVVATDGFVAPAGGPQVPFADGPVPCGQVLHPVGPSDPSATLLVSLPVDGILEPVHATEVVGAGQFVHVTTDAAYLATPLWDTSDQTAIHRFELSDLAHTGSGRVDGHLLDEFSMSDHDGVLRVAVTVGSGGWGPMPVGPMPVGPMPGAPVPVDGAEPSVASQPAEPSAALNEVVVLETDGDLGVIGRTARFGHPGETIHGIRFTDQVAYAVTFRQTDPFYVIDLTDPAAPRVAGEVELPGFSSYLHPISASLVAGFGPDGQGRAAVKLFDVADPTHPRVVDDLVLGDESAVSWDHHAFVDLGDGRFAVPASTYGGPFPEGCTLNGPGEECAAPAPRQESAVVVIDAGAGRLVEVDRQGVPTNEPAQRVLTSSAGWALFTGSQLVLLDESGAVRATLAMG